jgi:hypothetical protein
MAELALRARSCLLAATLGLGLPGVARADTDFDVRPPHTTLLVVGVASFFAAYAVPPAITMGACAQGTPWSGCNDKARSFIPIAGAFMFLDVPNTDHSYTGLMVGAGVVQGASLLLTFAALSIPQRHGRRTVFLAPTPGGAALAGTF